MTHEAPSPTAGSRTGLLLTIVGRAAAVLVLSVTLGLTFNSLNPLGIAWSRPAAADDSSRAEGSPDRSEDRGAKPPRAELPGITMDDLFFNSDPAMAAQIAVSTTNTQPAPEQVRAAVAPAPEIPPQRLPDAGPESITWRETKEWLQQESVLLLDARPKILYDLQHIPGAMSLPSTSSSREVGQMLGRHAAGKRVVIYCGDASCPLSKTMAERLYHEFNRREVYYMNGGFAEWLQDPAAAGALNK